ncbi:diacylglycerol kinase family protein [Chlorobium sp. N1]|uniref:diacylglycerol/lipid kinase family protein n=1 Tax=Chlorobium sp. N1 TaxID=2491138 RepID=UPI00103A4BD9|nr:diacylglycerol kinase family protein [Chlorobium sp. N1]TCD47926.1 diacylglycerol kinase family lipid kinase [Chlorobium sp. N1]
MATEPFLTFIVNPCAGGGRARRRLDDLLRTSSLPPQAEVAVSRHAGHAVELAVEAASRGRSLVACGGDGTLHEILNAVAGTGTALGVLPLGSANDFLKSFSPESGALPGSRRTRVDIGRVAFGGGKERHFINSLGLGFTGRIAGAVGRSRLLSGELRYVSALLRVLIGYAPVKMHIEITLPDRRVVLDEPVFAFSVGNGSVEGGKFRIAPGADLRDGLLDVCILRAIHPIALPGLILRYLRGTQARHPRVLVCRARRIELRLTGPEVLHMDGEVYRGVGGELSIEAVPGGLEMLLPEA